jgi:hypothetical protein
MWTIIITNLVWVLAILLFEPVYQATSHYLNHFERFYPDCLDTWGNASIEHRDQLYAIARLSYLVNLIMLLSFLSSGLLLADTRNENKAKAGPWAMAILGCALILIMVCASGKSEPIQAGDEVSRLTAVYFGSEFGIVLFIFLLSMIVFQVIEEIVRLLVRLMPRRAKYERYREHK